MQAGESLDADAIRAARTLWDNARRQAIFAALELHALNAHKQIVNRLLNPFMYTTAIFSATTWTNWFALRNHAAAEPHFRQLAQLMQAVMDANKPDRLSAGQWHLPLVSDEDRIQVEHMHPEDTGTAALVLAALSVGRCARVSYLTHDGRRDIAEDVRLHDTLMTGNPLHASPAEHVAQALDWPYWYINRHWEMQYPDPYALEDQVTCMKRITSGSVNPPTQGHLHDCAALAALSSGNFLGWTQYRKRFVNEHSGGARL